MVMSSLPPRELYQALAVSLRSRLDFAERILSMNETPAQIVEPVSLQGRKCLELIAYMMLAATEHGFGKANVPRDIRTQWNAETVFERLKKKSLDLIPSPQRVSISADPGYALVIEGVAAHRLNYDQLISLFRLFHAGLHEPNPYVQPDSARHYADLLPKLREGIEQIKNLTWQHMIFIRGKAFICFLSDDHGRVGVTALDKIPVSGEK